MSERAFMSMLQRRFDFSRNIGIEINSQNTPPESIYGDGSIASNLAFIKATRHFAGAYEINFPSFSKDTLRNIIKDTNDIAPEIPVMLKGCSCPDVAFDELGADAVTGLSPYPGGEMLSHFFLRNKKGVFVLCYDLSGKFQDKYVLLDDNEERRLFFENVFERDERPSILLTHEYVAYSADRIWNKNKNCGLDMCTSRHGIIKGVRKIVGDMPLLVRHVSTKEEIIREAICAGRDRHGQGIILFPNPMTISREDPRGDIERLHVLFSSLNV